MAWVKPLGIPHPGDWFLSETGDVTEVTSGSTGGNTQFSGSGTPSSPKIFRGVGTPTFSGAGYVYVSGDYVILDGVRLTSNRVFRFASGSHICFRNSEVTGNMGSTSKGTVSSNSDASYCVGYNLHIHDNGDWQSATENDIHGFTGSAGAHHIWLLDSHCYHNQGDSVQFGHDIQNQINSVYIGRNSLHEDRENAIDIKEITDFVASQNTCYGYRSTSSSEGAAIVGHYCHSNWNLLFNTIYNCDVGISNTSLLSRCATNVGVPIINRIMGNLIYNIAGIGIQGWGSNKIQHYAGNTIYGTGGAGMDLTNLISGSYIENNILQNITGSDIIYTGTAVSRNNIRKTQDALFVNPGALNFRLQSGSPAINAGVTPQSYLDYATYFGESILFDHDGNARPVGTWDIGAYEYGSSSVSPPNGVLQLQLVAR